MNTDLMFSSKVQDWETPQELFDEWNNIFHCETDVCATVLNTKCDHYFTPEVNGLKQRWIGVCWCNPPYGRKIGEWVRKAYYSATDENATVVMLLPARTDTRWFHDYIYQNDVAQIFFLKGRLLFSPNGDRSRRAPFPSMIVVFKSKTSKPKFKEGAHEALNNSKLMAEWQRKK